MTSIDWGVFDPGSSDSVTCYIRNEANADSTLSMYTSNWNPPDAADYVSFTWDYGGQSITPEDVIRVVFTLSVAADIQGIASFSFDITIVASG